MKRIGTGLLVLLFAGCVSGRIDVDDIPKFYLDPPVAKDSIFGVGDAQMSTLSMSKTMAISRAHDDVARQIEVSIRSAVTDYAQEAGEGNNNQAIQFAETVSRQIIEVTLRGVRQIESHIGRRGRFYVLIEYPLDELLAEAEAAFERNQAAAFSEFKAGRAIEHLNEEFENNPPRAGDNR